MIYLAAPLFNSSERTRNSLIASALERYAPVFLPQRDGALLAEMLKAGVPTAVAERRVFLQDCAALQKCTAVVAVLDGAHVDEGVAFEVGFGFSQGKVCVGLQDDVRRALPSGNNPMIGCALDAIFATELELLGWAADKYASKRLAEAG